MPAPAAIVADYGFVSYRAATGFVIALRIFSAERSPGLVPSDRGYGLFLERVEQSFIALGADI